MASYTWFLASPNEQLEALPGWRVPAPPLGPRRCRSVTNPFTGGDEVLWDYGEQPLGYEPIADADYPELHGLPQLSGHLSAVDFSELIQALTGEDSSQVLGLVLSLRASGPPDAECEVLRVPTEFVEPLAREARDAERVATLWEAASAGRQAVNGNDHAVLAQWFTYIRELAQGAATGPLSAPAAARARLWLATAAVPPANPSRR